MTKITYCRVAGSESDNEGEVIRGQSTLPRVLSRYKDDCGAVVRLERWKGRDYSGVLIEYASGSILSASIWKPADWRVS